MQDLPGLRVLDNSYFCNVFKSGGRHHSMSPNKLILFPILPPVASHAALSMTFQAPVGSNGPIRFASVLHPVASYWYLLPPIASRVSLNPHCLPLLPLALHCSLEINAAYHFTSRNFPASHCLPSLPYGAGGEEGGGNIQKHGV